MGQESFAIVCAWCGRIETRDTPPSAPAAVPGPASPISHTICDACFNRERAQVEQIVRARRREGRRSSA